MSPTERVPARGGTPGASVSRDRLLAAAAAAGLLLGLSTKEMSDDSMQVIASQLVSSAVADLRQMPSGALPAAVKARLAAAASLLGWCGEADSALYGGEDRTVATALLLWAVDIIDVAGL